MFEQDISIVMFRFTSYIERNNAFQYITSNYNPISVELKYDLDFPWMLEVIIYHYISWVFAGFEMWYKDTYAKQ